MPKKLFTSCHHRLASGVSARGKIMSLPCAGCCRNGASYMVDVGSGCCGRCLEKNLKCSLVVTQGYCKQSCKISYFLH